MASVGVTGASLAGFAIAANPVAAQVITTPTDGLTVTETTVPSAGFQVPIYEARPAAAGRYPVVLVIPEVWGMHEHIKDVARRFAREGFLAITFETYAREGGTLQLPDQPAVMKVANSVPDAQGMGDLDALVAYAKAHPAAQADRMDALRGRADVIVVGDAHVELPALLTALRGRGLTRMLTEGGPSLLGALAADDLIDEVVATMAARSSGSTTKPNCAGARRRQSPTARSSVGSRAAWSGARARSATAPSWAIRAAPT